MLLDTLKAQRSAVLALCQRYGARHIRVFGSVARGDDRPDSDVDFLVDFPRGYDLFSQRLPRGDLTQDEILYDAALRNLQTLSEATQLLPQSQKDRYTNRGGRSAAFETSSYTTISAPSIL
jgi:hypothetical protein